LILRQTQDDQKAVAKRHRYTGPTPSGGGGLGHANGGVLHLLALFFGHFQLG